jgi:hypothetical protein
MTRAPVDLIRHIEKHIGPIHTTFQEILSDDLQIDVHHVKSSLFRRFEVVVTTGMSAKPMSVPAESKESRFAEVLAILPKGWPLKKPAFDDEKNYWPIRLLKTLARHVHHANTWFGLGHTHANGASEADTKPYADGTQLCAVMLLPPASLGEAAWTLKRSNGEEVFFWSAVPLHMDELKFKMARGVDPLLELFDKNGVSDRIDPLRQSAVKSAT